MARRAASRRAAAASAFLRHTGRDVVYVNDHFANYEARPEDAVAA